MALFKSGGKIHKLTLKIFEQATQYIGEICRYLLAVPPGSNDRAHKVNVIIGNGLRPQIWPEFVQRFGIKRVLEFYGATEGNSNLGKCGLNMVEILRRCDKVLLKVRKRLT